MKENIAVPRRTLAAISVCLTVFSLLAGSAQLQANAYPFSHQIVFGDSLSDIGNYYRLSGGDPPPPYFDGRFCNGLLWVEYVAQALRMPAEPTMNFAVAGATTGTDNSNDGYAEKEYPGVQDQIASFMAAGPVTEPERALYIVEAGGNDFFEALKKGTSPAELIGAGVNNTVNAIKLLSGAGARHILVMNVPNLGVTPATRSLGENAAAMVTQLCVAYNQVLDQALVF